MFSQGFAGASPATGSLSSANETFKFMLYTSSDCERRLFSLARNKKKKNKGKKKGTAADRATEYAAIKDELHFMLMKRGPPMAPVPENDFPLIGSGPAGAEPGVRTSAGASRAAGVSSGEGS